ncbi:uncharacterized protein Z518_05932 [Rhinocladiella mackenziei CBS 650.93]|uniref:Rhinocladiella mackenziei CBS 650.93 unplaced genomic scaffold supercont1.4, whole genome shotgun sequence n=1 Tax=Rhinocladiella mackenziei CBS 650.93 TaxID=1442369 RepID=A0A0D2J7Q1_9EURO|nr:uncharacterized protein Z518_05932 [Rhinocladiella mackenziei CBS 650.93]KIX05060.1 hypothetical protein Z518_05932 [Rhinocladiella mackenziei CBS 650.93]
MFPPPLNIDMQTLQHLRTQFSHMLKNFTSSPSSTFRILHTIPSTATQHTPAIRTLYVLDSSFNPPSKAHLSLVQTALESSSQNAISSSGRNSRQVQSQNPRVLFLLATINADKTPEPADFEDRLVMMTLMAEQLRSNFSSNDPPAAAPPVIDIGVTKEPYFIDKARSIDESNIYNTPSESGRREVIEQIHLTGFDTLIRIFTPKYYPNYTPPLSALAPFLARHRLRATIRPDPAVEFSTVEAQKAYFARIAKGEMEGEGLKREWVDRVELVLDETGEAEGVSSTRVREAVKKGDWEVVKELVGEGVQAWIREKGLYLE